MPRSARAVLFDLDDTLYPRRRFVLSGFASVARHLHRLYALDEARIYRTLVHAYRHGSAGQELQACLVRFNLPETLLPGLVALMRSHRPALRLPASSQSTLQWVRRHSQIGIVTNGFPSTQANKVRALGLLDFVDEVVFATEHGTGRGKPDVAPFLEALERLEVEPRHAIFVGDDEACDIGGAVAAGVRAIRVTRGRVATVVESAADVVVRSLAEVPDAIEILKAREGSRDAA
jgi:putative hydrolase of the HAD superfamily